MPGLGSAEPDAAVTQALAARLPARRLMREAGIDPQRSAPAALAVGQSARLLAATTVVNAELAACAIAITISAIDRDARRSPRRGRSALPAALARP